MYWARRRADSTAAVGVNSNRRSVMPTAEHYRCTPLRTSDRSPPTAEELLGLGEGIARTDVVEPLGHLEGDDVTRRGQTGQHVGEIEALRRWIDRRTRSRRSASIP